MYKIDSSLHSRAQSGMRLILSQIEVDDKDYVTLDLLGDALSTMYEAIDGIKLSGLVINSGNIPKANPYVKIKNDAKLEAFKIMKQFGLNPLDRKKLEKGEIEEEESELDKLIGEML